MKWQDRSFLIKIQSISIERHKEVFVAIQEINREVEILEREPPTY